MELTRTHTCGQLKKSLLDQTVCIMGWVNSRRDHGNIVFLDIRDRYGVTQTVFNSEKSTALHKEARHLKPESTVAITGQVCARPSHLVNPNMATGEIEVEVTGLEILSVSKTPPFTIDQRQDIGEDLRLTYRYLDLRHPKMQRNLIMRHKAAQATRSFLNENDFLEIETPFLMKRTPEGARDYLVPSRLYNGKFYALPQSPQIYKQLLMLAGYDRYYQIVKCFRDEDLRSDRQPEFTQIDIETSFLRQDQILEFTEGLMRRVYRDVLGVELESTFPRMTYQEAMARYGSDKPDIRFDMELTDLSSVAAESGFKVFADTVAAGGQVKAIAVKGGEKLSRSRLDKLTGIARKFGAKGLVWIKLSRGNFKSPIAKFLTDRAKSDIIKLTGAVSGDVILAVADRPAIVAEALGRLRLELGKELKLIDENKLCFLWVTEFPLLERDEEEERWTAMHHPFTAPMEEDASLFETDPGAIRAQAYDLVLNGVELGGGSVRIHRREVQDKMFHALGMTQEETEEKFGFLLNAFDYGAPPHGGIALGFDRLTALLVGEDNIRQVIAFPKTNRALSLMDGSPSEVEPGLLEELGLLIKPKEYGIRSADYAD
ncbi:MAG: aspartate--tRNA ligase [Candidatus Cloacimonetes bacterium 4572_55]|nr:MAG: aspartate--tRNA ligase [Candidatus Cloacimonetes bacterium 4572_55]